MAPTSAAERKRKSCANKTEEQKLLEREKARNYMKQLRLKRKGDKKLKKTENEASKLRMRKMRAKNKLESSSMSSEPKNPFSSPQSFGKALKRTKSALPHSPRKKIAIIKKVATELGIPIVDKSTHTERRSVISDEVKNVITKFYCSDEISRQLPGKKDVKSFKDPITKKKVTLQKRLLMYNLKEVHELFKADNPAITIGLSKFCELRPIEVDTVGSKDHEVCCCPYCENIGFIMKACKFKDSTIKTINDLISLIVCDKYSPICMKHKCATCSTLFNEVILRETSAKSQQSTVNQWNGKLLETKSFDSEELLKEFLEQIPKVSEHIYNISRQHKELRKQKGNLKPNEALLQIDFAQNYQIKHQNEVMAAHWKTNQDKSVSIYTAVIYYRQESDGDLLAQTYGIISDAKNHSSLEVKVFNEQLLLDFQNKFNKKLKNVNIWSDGASAHLKNRYSMAIMTSSDVITEWNFSASYHGKGPHDGVGLVLKRHVWKKVLQGKTVIMNAHEFFTEVTSSGLNVRCLFVSEKIVNMHAPQTEKLFEEIKAMNGIKSAHCIKKISSFCANMYINTGDATPFVENINLLNNVKISKRNVPIELEKYYSVYYDDKWYLGRVLLYDNGSELAKIKFLQETHAGFKWPNHDDVQMVERKFILHGPVNLTGNLPFTITEDERQKINTLYKNCKK